MFPCDLHSKSPPPSKTFILGKDMDKVGCKFENANTFCQLTKFSVRTPCTHFVMP